MEKGLAGRTNDSQLLSISKAKIRYSLLKLTSPLVQILLGAIAYDRTLWIQLNLPILQFSNQLEKT